MDSSCVYLKTKKKEICDVIASSFPPSLLSFLFLFPADTKRKVEQISEELRSLDEMLAGNEGADGAVEVTAEETSPAPSEDPNMSDTKGTFLSQLRVVLSRNWNFKL